MKKGDTGGESKMPKIPIFTSEKQTAKWFATHDTASHMDELDRVKEKIPVRRTRPKKETVGLRLRSDQVAAIKQSAKRRRISYQTLIEKWVTEKLRQEVPNLSHK
jgi:predicted DNA binding CopG/RHH family protein